MKSSRTPEIKPETKSEKIEKHRYPLRLWECDDYIFEPGLLLTTKDDFDYTGTATANEKKMREEVWPLSSDIPSLKK